jgi:hypothetical protein
MCILFAVFEGMDKYGGDCDLTTCFGEFKSIALEINENLLDSHFIAINLIID